MNRRIAAASVVVALLVAGGGLAIANNATNSEAAPKNPNGAVEQKLVTAVVQRGDLATTQDFSAKASFGDSYDAPFELDGTITYQRPVGDVVQFGESFIRVDEQPVFLAEGSMPLYRELRKTNTKVKDEFGKKVQLLEGDDVRQLQTFLNTTRLPELQLEVDGVFGATTERAVKLWQELVGFGASGSVDSAQLMFSPNPLRIASETRVGASFDGLKVSVADAIVTIDTSNRDRSALPVDSEVTVELPDGTKLVGRVTEQKQATKNDGSSVWRTTIAVTGEIPGDVNSVKVIATIQVAADVLHVPVGALISLAEGGFAVEVSDADGTTLVRVEVGEVLDGQAVVAGEVAEGDAVVVPT
jgi:peptidoglycan hydrolase-like protein with peptidoglycan-binding domain